MCVYDYIWKRETQLVSNIDYFIIIWYNIAKEREHEKKGVHMERIDMTLTGNSHLQQASANCGENVEQAQACCHASPSFDVTCSKIPM